MPQIKHTFTKGRMNKDLDERLVPNGEYRDAMNIEVAGSEGDDVGAAQNILGNKIRGAHGITNANCVGAIANTATEKIYYFITSSTTDAIIEYDQTNDTTLPVVIDKQNVLNFKYNNENFITGINIIDDLLFFTDNNSEPKVVNIERFKAGCATGAGAFTTHTTLLKQKDGVAYDFKEDDVTVIKKGPSTAPTITMSNLKRDPNNTRPLTSTANFSFGQTVNGEVILREVGHFYPVAFSTFNLPNWQIGDIIVFTLDPEYEYETNEEFSVRCVITNIIGEDYPENQISMRIVSIDESTPTEQISWLISLEQEEPMFEKDFIRFAYRWKYIDGEYSTISPFSQVAFLPKEFDYEPAQAYNLGMVNDLRYLKVSNFRPTDTHDQVDEIDLLFKKENNTNIYTVKTFKVDDPEFHSSEFEIESELIYKVIAPNQLLRPFDSVPLKAKAQEIVANRIVYGNYTHNFDLATPKGVDVIPEIQVDQIVDSTLEVGVPGKSLKSQRTYQLGVVYRDEYGRETPVQAQDTGTFYLDKNSSINRTSISATLSNQAPSFASSFKFFIKETSNEYYNLAMDRWYDAEDGNVWLSFPSAERNKVDEETFLILKKQHDSDEPVLAKAKYKIIAIANEAPEDIKQEKKVFGTLETQFKSEAFPLLDGLFFDVTKDDFEDRFGDVTNGENQLIKTSNVVVRIVSALGISAWYDVANINLIDNASEVRVTLRDRFRSDVTQFFPDGTYASGSGSNAQTSLGAEFAAIESRNKPEFTGRFFVKIYRDSSLQENILNTTAVEDYKISTTETMHSTNITESGGPPQHGGTWRDYCEGPPSCVNSSKNLGFFFTNRHNGIKDWKNGPHGSKPSLLNGYSDSSLPSWIGLTPIKIGRKTIAFRSVAISQKLSGHLSENRFRDFVTGITTDGTAIRFVEDSQQNIYKIKKHAYGGFRQYDKRTQSDSGWESNKHMVFVLELDRPIENWDSTSVSYGTNYKNGDCFTIQILTPYGGVNERSDSRSDNPAIFETEPKEAIDLDLYFEASDAIPVASHNNAHTLAYHNCYSFGNGVESNRIRDDFNAPTIAKGVKASAPLAEQYKQEIKKTGLIFSQIYNSMSGVNRTNQFIIAENIIKDLNPVYGSIQKLHTRDTDLTVCCEDKILKVLANKDALFNADGNVNVTSNTAVLGQSVPYVGEYGISKNPESFVSYGFQAYFADKARGVVLRLSRNGLDEISAIGMRDYFRDKLAQSNFILGSFDDKKDMYNLTMVNKVENSVYKPLDTVSFKINSKGWTSRKSFIPEMALSLNNTYYSLKNGKLYSHDNETRNTFYDEPNNFTASSIKVILNDFPGTIKSFKTISYEGSQGKVRNDSSNVDGLPYNITPYQGWYLNSIETDKQSGEIPEFIEKEGKWFNYIKGDATTLSNLDTKEFNVQGIGSGVTITNDTGPSEVIITIKENND